MSRQLLDTTDDARHIRAIMAERPLPRGVVDYGLSFGEDWAGDLAATVWLVVEDGSNPSDEDMRPIIDYVRELRDALVDARLSHWPFVRFIHRSEAGPYLGRK